jgi:hypothetical protein
VGTIVSYLNDFGATTLEEVPFNEVDNLVLSVLSYLDLTGIVPTINERGDVSVEQAMSSAVLLAKRSFGITPVKEAFMDALGSSARFGQARLKNLQVHLDAQSGTQFCALEIVLPDHTSYVSFRGTDNSFVGWKEDFTMSYQIMPSEREAARYLDRVIRLTRRYRIGGHSKGGTLAEYGALRCSPLKQRRIIAVYNNDGPGLAHDVVGPVSAGALAGRIMRIVPAYDVFGQLFQDLPADMIVHSDNEGIMQHDAFSWQVEGTHFVEAAELSPDCAFINHTLHTWIESLDLEGRKHFIDDFFTALDEKGIHQQTDFSDAGPIFLQQIALEIVAHQGPGAEGVVKLAAAGVGALDSFDLRAFLHEQHLTRGIFLMCLSIFFMVNPDFAAHTFGYIMGAAALIWLTTKVIKTAEDTTLDVFNARLILVGRVAEIALVAFAMAEHTLITRFANIILGALFLVASFQAVRKATSGEGEKRWRIANALIALGAFVLGMFPMLTANSVVAPYIYVASIVVALYSAGSIVLGLWVAAHPQNGPHASADTHATADDHSSNS